MEPLSRPAPSAIDPRQTESERLAFLARRRGRNRAMLVAIAALMVLFYFVTIAKIGIR